MQVYAVVYCEETDEVLVCRKKTKAYFFKRKLKGRGISLTKKGGGKYCFPGGGLDNGEDPRAGAVREFREETGVTLANASSVLELKISESECTGFVFCFRREQFQTIFTEAFVNIEKKETLLLRHRVQPGNRLTALPQEISNGSIPIQDDELESAERRKIENCMGYGIFQKNNEATGWFYDMCSRLMTDKDIPAGAPRKERRYSFP